MSFLKMKRRAEHAFSLFAGFLCGLGGFVVDLILQHRTDLFTQLGCVLVPVDARCVQNREVKDVIFCARNDD